MFANIVAFNSRPACSLAVAVIFRFTKQCYLWNYKFLPLIIAAQHFDEFCKLQLLRLAFSFLLHKLPVD